MLMYASLCINVFSILASVLQRFNLNCYCGWKIRSLSLEDQLLITLMKLRINLKYLDLAERFNISRSAGGNIIYTFVHVLHKLLFEGILVQGIPSQLKCQGCLPKSFKEFVTTRAVIDVTELTQDTPSNLNKQSDCYSQYTVKAVTCVAPNGALVCSSSLYPGEAPIIPD